MRFVFGPWEPDKPPHLSTALVTVRNAYPGPLGYRPMKSFVAAPGGGLGQKCFGAGLFVTPQGLNRVIAGTQTSLYQAQYTAWQQIGTGFNTPMNGRWRFEQFGGLAIATNGVDPMQKIDLVSGMTTNLSDTVSSAKGVAPRTQLLAVVKDFLVAGVINGDVQQIAWSGINDAQWWRFGQNQSDFNIMPSGGEVNGIFGGEFGVILQRNRITRMDYVGDNVVFQISEISSNVGCVTANSVAQWGNLGFFLADNGFMMWDGSGLKAIGQERVDRYFHSFYSKADFVRMSAAIDQRNTVIVWNMGDRAFMYNWLLDQWTVSDQALQLVFAGLSRDITLDELDGVFPNLDAMTVSLDDPQFQGGNPQFYAFDSTYNLGTLMGPNLIAEFRLARAEPKPGRGYRSNMARPITDAASGVTIEIAATQRLNQTMAPNTYTMNRTSGDVPIREAGRYIEPGMIIAASTAWTYAQGLDVDITQGPRY